MKFLVVLAAFAAAAVAAPAELSERNYMACNAGLYSNPKCCGTDVLGVADLDCQNPSRVPHSADDFKQICASEGATAMCCAVPVAGQGVLCSVPVGISS